MILKNKQKKNNPDKRCKLRFASAWPESSLQTCHLKMICLSHEVSKQDFHHTHSLVGCLTAALASR